MGIRATMNFKKRRMVFIPDVNPKSFVLFFEKGTTGRSWSLRDYSVENTVRRFGPQNFPWTADEIQEKVVLSIDAPAVRTEVLTFWCDHTQRCNQEHHHEMGLVPKLRFSSSPTSKGDLKNGWDDYLLLHHFDPTESVDDIGKTGKQPTRGRRSKRSEQH
jgi:hypothetical protein